MADKSEMTLSFSVDPRLDPPRAELSQAYALTFLTGPQRGLQVTLDGKRRYRLGRGEDAEVRLDDLSVSRVHAEILVSESGSVVIWDQGSRNGTEVNGERLPAGGRRVIGEGAKIRLGNELMLRLSLVDAIDESFQAAMYDAAVKDPMTGAFNRRYMHESLERELALAHRYSLPVALIIFDVDHFKKINDTYGHQAGDTVLVALVEAVRETLRTEDLLARYGGEEFVLIARNLTLENAMVFAERVRKVLESLVVTHAGRAIPFTASFGVTSTSAVRYGAVESMVKDADSALYRAKQAGRNRCERFTAPEGLLSCLAQVA